MKTRGKMLVVDDERDVVETLDLGFNDESFEAPRAEQALEAARREQPDAPRAPIAQNATLLALALVWITGASCGFSPASPTGASPTGGHEVQLDDSRAAEYWVQFEHRLPLWFNKISAPVPVVPPRDQVLAEAQFVEIEIGEAETCWYDPPDRLEIRIDMWESGCVPHEIGHLALRMAGHPCWAEWEHETEIQKCLDRIR
jgi:hypothetical protein